MKVLDLVDQDIKDFYKKSINALGKLEKRPSEKEWNKIAGEKLYMTSISLKGYSEIDSWILLCFNARRSYNKNKWAVLLLIYHFTSNISLISTFNAFASRIVINSDGIL